MGCGKGFVFVSAEAFRTAKNGLHNECDTWNSVERRHSSQTISRGALWSARGKATALGGRGKRDSARSLMLAEIVARIGRRSGRASTALPKRWLDRHRTPKLREMCREPRKHRDFDFFTASEPPELRRRSLKQRRTVEGPPVGNPGGLQLTTLARLNGNLTPVPG